MTLRYAHLSPRHLADEVKALDKYHGNGKSRSTSNGKLKTENSERHDETDPEELAEADDDESR